MTLEEAKKFAIEETKFSGKRQIVYLIFEDGDILRPNFSFCETDVFEEKIENDFSLLPIAETTEDLTFDFLQFLLF